MARILLVWEHGAGFSHLAALGSLARALAPHGHTLDVVLPHLDAGVGKFFEGTRATLLPAPRQRTRRGTRTPASYADSLLDHGFDDADALVPPLAAWNSLFELCRPDLALFHAAPLALIASRHRPMRRVAFGTGFWLPPSTDPLPPLRYWEPEDAPRAQEADRRLVEVMGKTFAAAGLPRPQVSSAARLFETDRVLLRTFPELDHYRDRSGGTYLGTAFTLDMGQAPRWPDGEGPRVFCYLTQNTPFLKPLLDAVSRLSARVVLCVPGLPASVLADMDAPNVWATADPVRLDQVREACDLAVTHGAGTVAAMLTAGVPVVVLPETLEQLITGRRARELGAGTMPREGPAQVDLAKVIEQALADEDLRRAAREFAHRYQGYDPRQTDAEVVENILALLKEG